MTSKKKLKKRIKKLEHRLGMNEYIVQRLVNIVMKKETKRD